MAGHAPGRPRRDVLAERQADMSHRIAKAGTPRLALSSAYDWFRGSAAKLAKAGDRGIPHATSATVAADAVREMTDILSDRAAAIDATLIQMRQEARSAS